MKVLYINLIYNYMYNVLIGVNKLFIILRRYRGEYILMDNMVNRNDVCVYLINKMFYW